MTHFNFEREVFNKTSSSVKYSFLRTPELRVQRNKLRSLRIRFHLCYCDHLRSEFESYYYHFLSVKQKHFKVEKDFVAESLHLFLE